MDLAEKTSRLVFKEKDRKQIEFHLLLLHFNFKTNQYSFKNQTQKNRSIHGGNQETTRNQSFNKKTKQS